MPVVIFDIDKEEFEDVGWIPIHQIISFVEVIKTYGISTDNEDYKFFGSMFVSFWDGKKQFVIEASHSVIDE